MKNLISLIACFLFSACTQTMTMVHTQGTADDVVDETSSATPNVSPNISIPASAAGLL